MPAFQNLYISSINGGTLRSTRQSKSLEVAPHIKAVSFHFQTSVYGIKCNITKKKTVLLISKKGTSCVSFWYGLKLRELLRRIRAWSSFAQNLEKAHLPETMKSPSFPKAMSLLWATKISPCLFCIETFMFNAFQNLTHQPAEAPFWEHSGRFTFRPRYQVQ